MTKIWKKFAECIPPESLSEKINVSHSPKKKVKISFWNTCPLPPVMLIALSCSMINHGVNGTSMDGNPHHHQQHHQHHNHHQNDFPNASNAHQVQDSQTAKPISLSTINQYPEIKEDIILELFECSEAVQYPNDFELFMQKWESNDEEEDELHPDWRNRKNVGENTELWETTVQLYEKRQARVRAQIRLHQKSLDCPENKYIQIFHWHPKWTETANLSETRKQPIPGVELSNISLFENGDLVWIKEQGQHHIYKKDEYCISREKGKNWGSFVVCTSNCSQGPCARKCCPPSQVINRDTRGCVPADPPWRPIFYRGKNEQEKGTETFFETNTSIIVGFPSKCEKYEVGNQSPSNNFKLLLNGSLLLIDGVKQNHIKMEEFCIDGVYNGKNSEGLPVRYSRSEWDQIVIACVPNNNVRYEIDKWRIPLYASLNCVSAVFLLLTDIVYLLLWRHQNIHGWLQFSYATSLFCTFNCFVIVQWWSRELISISTYLCKIMGYFSAFFYLSAFFWLTSMNFDLFWTFSRPLQNSRMRPQVKKFKRFLGFAAFSIGVPVLICSIGITVDTVYDSNLLDPPFTVPGFGKDRCYFENKRSQVPYLYGPAMVLLLVDLIFFTSTVLHLRKIHAHTELARTQSTMEDKKGLRVFAKLFVVMGVLWVFELVPWVAHILLPDKEMILIYIFIPIDVLNCLQGVAIFYIFVCKPNVVNQLMALFRKDDAAMTWNKQTQLPSVATVQQTIKPNDYTTDLK